MSKKIKTYRFLLSFSHIQGKLGDTMEKRFKMRLF